MDEDEFLDEATGMMNKVRRWFTELEGDEDDQKQFLETTYKGLGLQLLEYLQNDPDRFERIQERLDSYRSDLYNLDNLDQGVIHEGQTLFDLFQAYHQSGADSFDLDVESLTSLDPQADPSVSTEPTIPSPDETNNPDGSSETESTGSEPIESESADESDDPLSTDEDEESPSETEDESTSVSPAA